MSNVAGFICVECARRYLPGEVEYVCANCGGNLDVLYDYERIATQLSKASLEADDNRTIWRYRPLLPIEEMSEAPPLAVGWTPVYDCPALASRYGAGQLLIKDDGRNPTASFKDRPSALAVVKAREAGARIITTASSGNAGSALAGMCASVGMKSIIFVPQHAPAAKIAQLQIYGSIIALVEGSYDEAYDLCINAARRFGWYQRSTGYNPFMSEGKKTAALEIGEQLRWELPDKVFVAVGDGCIIGGLWKGFNDLHRLGFVERLPQMIGVQAEGAAAIVDAVSDSATSSDATSGDAKTREGSAHTIADSINVGKPRDATKAIRAIRESGGQGIKVSDDEMILGIVDLARATGVFVEPAAAASFAGFVKMCQQGAIKSDERVLLVLTGNGLKDIESARRALKEPMRVRPDIDEFTEMFARLERSGASL